MIITKLLSTRMVQYLPNLIEDNQRAFLKSRSAVDNAMILLELIY